MRTTILSTCALLISFTVTNAQTIPNSGFEDWNNMGTYSEPVGWLTNNPEMDPQVGITQQQPGHDSPSCIRLVVQDIPDVYPQSGVSVSGTGGMFLGGLGYPCAARPATLDGFWRYAPAGTDLADVHVTFTRWNTSTLSRDFVGSGAANTPSTNGDWSAFSMPIGYLIPDMPDTAIIWLQAGNNANVGSQLDVDDLQFTGTVGVSELDAAPLFSLLPSAGGDHLIVRLAPGHTASELTLLDVTGRVLRMDAPKSNESTIPLVDLVSECYLVQVRFTNGAVAVQRFVR